MWLSVYSLRKPVLRKEAQSVNLKTKAGEITILDNHRPLISVLKAGKVNIVDASGKQTSIEIQGGMLEVRPDNRVTILAD